MYYDSDIDYKEQVGCGDKGNDKLIDTDDTLRCLVYKNDKANKEMTYDDNYALYDSMDHSIIQIVK